MHLLEGNILRRLVPGVWVTVAMQCLSGTSNMICSVCSPCTCCHPHRPSYTCAVAAINAVIAAMLVTLSTEVIVL